MELKSIFDYLTPDYNQRKKMFEAIMEQSRVKNKNSYFMHSLKPALCITSFVLAVSVCTVLFYAVRRDDGYIAPEEGGVVSEAADEQVSGSVTVAETEQEKDYQQVIIESEKEENTVDTGKSVDGRQDESSLGEVEMTAVSLIEEGLSLELSAPLMRGEYHVSEEYDGYIGHKGIDLAAERGTAIYAVADGVVSNEVFDGNDSESFWNMGYGNCVIIEHDGGITTLYGHCSEVLVDRGQAVKKGDLIARVGQTGLVAGNCLHFEILIDGEHIDPRKMVNFD